MTVQRDSGGRRYMSAKMLSDRLMLQIIAWKKADFGDGYHSQHWPGGGSWTLVCDFSDLLPGVPHAVILAKMDKLIRRGLATGCTCGCRGDFELTDDGLAFLEAYESNYWRQK